MNTGTNLHSAAKVIMMTATKCFVICFGFVASIAYLGYYLAYLLIEKMNIIHNAHHIVATVCLCVFFGIVSFGTGKSALKFAIDSIPEFIKSMKFW